MLVFVLLLLFVILMSCGNTSEKFIEMFGFSGYKKPKDVDLNIQAPELSGFVESSGSVTPDEIQNIVLSCQDYFKSKTGLCVYALETNSVKKYTKEGSVLYVVRFMFTVTNTGFPYGIGATFHVLDSRVVGAVTQQMGGGFKAVGSEPSYLSYDQIVADQRKVILDRM